MATFHADQAVSNRLKSARAFLGYAIATVLISALVAPWVYWGVQLLAQTFDFQWLARQPFRRVFNRVILVVALVGLWPLWRTLRMRSWHHVGWLRHPDAMRHLVTGFAMGAVSLVLAVLAMVWLDHQTLSWDRTGLAIAVALLRFMAVACVVAVIEETFFRGGIQGAMQRDGGFVPALVITSTVYSAVHFLKPKWNKTVEWWSGFDYVGTVLTQSFHGKTALVGFVSLFLVGCVLGWAYYRTRALYLSVGLHAGWVVTNEFCRWLGLGQIRDHPVAWPALIAVWAAVAWLHSRQFFRPVS